MQCPAIDAIACRDLADLRACVEHLPHGEESLFGHREIPQHPCPPWLERAQVEQLGQISRGCDEKPNAPARVGPSESPTSQALQQGGSILPVAHFLPDPPLCQLYATFVTSADGYVFWIVIPPSTGTATPLT